MFEVQTDAVLTLIAAAAVPNFLKFRSEAQAIACVSNMNTLRTAGECWRMNQTDPTAVPAVSDLVGTDSTKFIRKDPAKFQCPKGGAYTIGTAEDGAITITCPNGHTLP